MKIYRQISTLNILGSAFLCALLLTSCEDQNAIPTDLTTATAPVPLTAAEVTAVVTAVAQAIDDSEQVIVVTDRRGVPLAVYEKPDATATGREQALSQARTAAFFSNDQAPLSSRTVRAISRPNFPEGIINTASGALFGIENTNRGCDFNAPFAAGKDIDPATALDGVSPSLGIATTPGSVPLYRDGRLLGGVGVGGIDTASAEFAASQALAVLPPTVAAPGVVFIDGIALPFITETDQPDGTAPGTLDGVFTLAPIDGGIPPDGYLVEPRDSLDVGEPRLLSTDVDDIITRAIDTANRTRAQIRLPQGQRSKMVMAVSDRDGNVLGLFRMTDSTIFSIDVAVAKSRNVSYFSSENVVTEDQIAGLPLGTAVTNRTIGFGSQPFFPSGINGTDPGPYRDIYLYDSANPCTQGRQPANANQNGIVFFPGSTPLYKTDASGNRVLVGGFGVSGDGVEQDDYVTEGGSRGYEPPESIRADQYSIRDIRLPFYKFPRQPER